MSRELFEQLTEETRKCLLTLGRERVSIVANYFKTCVRVGLSVDPAALSSEITSASGESPLGNVVARLIPN
jgi:hypothetical protein